MRRRLIYSLLVLGTVILTPAISAAQSRQWLVIGDSWGVALEPVQRARIAELGWPFEVTGLAVSGSTAQQWARDENGWLTAAKEFLGAIPAGQPAVVYVSLGGNDLLDDYPTEGDQIFLRIGHDIRTVLRELLSTKPNTWILLGSYDILNFDRSLLCQVLGLAIFGSTDPAVVNPVFLIGSDVVQFLASRHRRVMALDVIGALQGSPGNPDLGEWSPAELITPDCIHLMPAGYEVFNDAVFEKLAAILGLE